MAEAYYADELKISEALQIYFSRYHFADGAYQDQYFRIKLGPFYIPVPNTEARIIAVKFHDIHHILTGYNALWKGETEIGAWEIASGCGKHHVAWFLNFGSFSVGSLLFPRALFRAFMRGRSANRNLYKGYDYSSLLEKTVKELRLELGINNPPGNRPGDFLLFAVCLLPVVAILLTTGFACFEVLRTILNLMS